MYSKYILSTNWRSLSSNYPYDSQINLSNQTIFVDGNVNLNFSPSLYQLNDYSNNNYSLLFLTKPTNINNLLNLSIPRTNTNKQICLLATDLENNLVSENTRFVKFIYNDVFLDSVINLNNNNFFELDFISANEVYVYTVQKNIYYFLCIDDVTLQITSISAFNVEDLTSYQKSKIGLNFLLDNKKNTILFYRTVQNKNYIISKRDGRVVSLQVDIESITDDNLFTIIKYGDLPTSNLIVNWVSYLPEINKNSIKISSNSSIFNLKNNFLIHNEYNTIKGGNINFNYITLKNQIDIKDNVLRNSKDNNFREYNSILTGENREKGYSNITLGYESDLYPLTLYSDKTTWFHVPYNKALSGININDSNFKINGSNPGRAPIFSDKIFKKAANYASTSNMGNVQDNEQSGTWLCSWLSGGPTDSVWVDRFYNPSSFTVLEALKYSTGVNYVPQYEGKYTSGITDVVSNLTLESGSWYAYTRLGSKTAKKIINGLNSINSKGLSFYKNKNKTDVSYTIDSDNESIYSFDKNNFGNINLLSSNYNNFTISFFGSRENWNLNREFQILGNYLDSGFGVFNDFTITPILYYIKNTTLELYNKDIKKIMSIDTSSYLNSGSNIVGLFRRDFNNNFHVITQDRHLLEFNANGTIIDSLSFGNIVSDIISVTNNFDNGYILDINDKIFEINLLSNSIKDISNSISIVKEINKNYPTSINNTLVADNFNKIYEINGLLPILKGINIYFISPDYKKLLVYNTNNNTVSTYLSGEKDISSYNFDNEGKTYVLYTDLLAEYDALGNFIKNEKIVTTKNNLSGNNLIIQKVDSSMVILAQLIDNSNKNYIYNFSLSSLKTIDTEFNSAFNIDKLFSNNRFDFSNYNYSQGIINSRIALPSYIFRIKLFNQLDYEDAKILDILVLGETLNSGEHHFAVTLNTLIGEYTLYLDGKLYKKITFSPKRYSFSNLYKQNLVVGTTPFYGNAIYSDFYKSDKEYLFVDDLKIEKIKTFKESLNSEEIRMLFFEKNNPGNFEVQLPIGSRNYLDTISRTFRHKMQGSKSNLINLFINDSLITDKDIKKMYEYQILEELKNVLPSYVKVNSITWLNNKDSDEKMLEGNFNARNTITEAQ